MLYIEAMARDLSAFLAQAGPDIDGNVLKGLNIKGVTPDEVTETIRRVFAVTQTWREE